MGPIIALFSHGTCLREVSYYYDDSDSEADRVQRSHEINEVESTFCFKEFHSN